MDDLLAQASALDREAVAPRHTAAERRALQRRAGELRLQALAGKPYPVLLCETCLSITGWLDATSRCASCARAELLGLTLADPAPNFAERLPQRPLRQRLREGLPVTPRGARRAWLRRVEPGVTGPARPTEGFALDVAARYEHDAPDGSGVLVRFAVSLHRFEYGRWAVAGAARATPVTPAAFAVSLPAVELAEAWFDFREEVAEANRRAWTQSEQARAAAAAEWNRRREAGAAERADARFLGD